MYENGIVNYIDVLDAQRNDAIAFSVRTDKKNRKKVIRWYIVRLYTFPLQ